MSKRTHIALLFFIKQSHLLDTKAEASTSFDNCITLDQYLYLSLRSKRCQSHNRYDHHHHGWSTSFTITTFIFGSGPLRVSGHKFSIKPNLSPNCCCGQTECIICKSSFESSSFLQCFLAVQDSSISDIVGLSVCRSVGAN